MILVRAGFELNECAKETVHLMAPLGSLWVIKKVLAMASSNSSIHASQNSICKQQNSRLKCCLRASYITTYRNRTTVFLSHGCCLCTFLIAAFVIDLLAPEGKIHAHSGQDKEDDVSNRPFVDEHHGKSDVLGKDEEHHTAYGKQDEQQEPDGPFLALVFVLVFI